MNVGGETCPQSHQSWRLMFIIIIIKMGKDDKAKVFIESYPVQVMRIYFIDRP